MGIGVLSGEVGSGAYKIAIMYCNTAEQAFGPVFKEGETHTAEEIARGFIEWHDAKYGDPRISDLDLLNSRYIDYLKMIDEWEE